MDNEANDIEIVVKIVRDTVDDRELATILFEGLKNDDDQDATINLAESDVSDIKTLFDSIFSIIYESKQSIKFQLEDSKSDLYNQVTKDIIDYLEKEIEQSRSNFEQIWQLVEDEDEQE